MADAGTAQPASANATGNGAKKMNLWWVLVVVNAALAVWAGGTSNLAHQMVFGHEPSDVVTTTLWKFLTAGFLIITGVAYALADAVNKGSESQPTYLLLDLGVIVHEGMSLVLMLLAAPLFRHEALICGPPIFMTAGGIAAFHYWRANPGGLKPDAIRESTMKTVKGKLGGDDQKATAALLYLTVAGALAMLALAYLAAPGPSLTFIFGTPGSKEAVAQIQTLGGAFLLPAAIFTYALKNAVEKNDVPASVVKTVNFTLAIASAIQMLALVPLLQQQQQAKTKRAMVVMLSSWGVGLVVFGGQALKS